MAAKAHIHKWASVDAGQAYACDCGSVKDCKHGSFHFENGGFHMVCDRCGDVYANVGKCRARFVQNIASRGLTLTENDRRLHPQIQSLPVRKKS